MKYEHYSTSEGCVSHFFQQVPHNVVKPTSGKQESTYGSQKPARHIYIMLLLVSPVCVLQCWSESTHCSVRADM